VHSGSHIWEQNVRRIEDRIVTIHQLHLRPIVRGKQTENIEFGAKIHVGLVNGYAFLDQLCCDAFNESTYLKDSVEAYKRRFGHFWMEEKAEQLGVAEFEQLTVFYEEGGMLKRYRNRGTKVVSNATGRPN